jgi:Xaa-Pro aminopeptidase
MAGRFCNCRACRLRYYILFDSEREAVLGRITTHSSDTRYFPRDALRGSTDFVVRTLKDEGWIAGTVGMEFSSYRPNRVISLGLQAAFEDAGARVVDCTHILRNLRWIKSASEINCLEEAARIANIGLATAHESIAPGVSELEVYGEIVRAMAAAGGENPGITMPVLSGSKTNALFVRACARDVLKDDRTAPARLSRSFVPFLGAHIGASGPLRSCL